jgi:hypothetical protein
MRIFREILIRLNDVITDVLFFIFSIMNNEIIIHASEFDNEAEFIRAEVEKNISGKLDAYLKKLAKEDAIIRTELTLTRDKVGISGKLEVSFPGNSFRSARESYVKLDDLVNHLFVHIKEQMAK